MNKEAVEQLLEKIPLLRQEIQKKIIGQGEVIDQLIVGLLAKGHVLLEGVPGLAKTLMIRTLSEALDLQFKRIQFTPDLMPSDILGTEILQENPASKEKYFKFAPGPVFTNILLADEINRTPPKTQSALLELMQEYGMTYAGQRYDLPKPFFLLATQNPIEQSGTFPLPEAQVDRFLLFVKVNYPTATEEEQILSMTTGLATHSIQAIYNQDEILQLQDLCRQVHIDDQLISKVSQLVRLTRVDEQSTGLVRDYVEWGAGPRAGQSWIIAAKAHALMQGRYAVTPPDLHAMLYPALRHRILLSFKAKAQQVDSDRILHELATQVNL